MNRRTAGLMLLAMALGTDPRAETTPGPGGRAVYVGSKTCRKCHFLQHRSWGQTAMANAFELLKPGVRREGKSRVGLDPDADYQGDEKCLECHATGTGVSGGFQSLEETPDLAGVGCEACHGPAGGDGYLAVMTLSNKRHGLEEMTTRGLIYPVTTQLCTDMCHNERSPHNAKVDPKYEFRWDERIRKGADHGHWKLLYEHGPLPGSLFQTIHPELRADFEEPGGTPGTP